MIHAPSLASPNIRHAFFTRAGGVSAGIYESLNGGIGSKDAPENVRENRARMATALGVAPTHLVTLLPDPFARRDRRRPRPGRARTRRAPTRS